MSDIEDMDMDLAVAVVADCIMEAVAITKHFDTEEGALENLLDMVTLAWNPADKAVENNG